MEVLLPTAVAETTAWLEIGAFRSATCASVLPMLTGGIPEGFTARLAFRRDDPAAPKFGDIPNARYAFAAVARNEACGVLAVGCSEADVGDVDNVGIPLSAVEGGPVGTCTEGATCVAARCVPANDNSDPSVGAGCSLELLGAGPLANTAGNDGTLMSAPAIAPTANGFMIVYREIDPGGSGARLVLLPIDASGGALEPERPGLPARCSTSDETDGIGLVLNGEDGMIALAKAPCGDNPALELLNFKTTNAADPTRPTLGKFLVAPSPNDVRVSLGSARAATLRPSGNLVAFTGGGVGRIATMYPDKGVDAPNGTFGGAGVTDAWITANDKVLALLAVGPAAPPPPPTGDAGADASIPIESPAESTMRLLVLPATTAVAQIDSATNKPRAPTVFPGVWGSIASIGGRVIVLTDGTGPGRSATYRAYDVGKDVESDSSGFAIDGTGRVTSGDVAIVENRAYFAVLSQGAIGLHVFANATTILTPLRDVNFSREPRISGISNVRDGRVAVAANDTRVAVVWTTARVLTKNDPAGGYAVFGCTK